MSTPANPKAFRWSRPAVLLALVLAEGSPTVPAAFAGETEASLVSADVFNGYTRTRLPDGSFQPEHYVLADGGRYQSVVSGDGIDQMPFRNLARLLAPALASRKYLPATNPEKTELLIVVSRGTTARLDKNDPGYWVYRKRFAGYLGFVADMNRATTLDFTTFAKDLRRELEAPRYFVVLQAYDFPTARKEDKLKLLWETHFSIQTQGNDFENSLPRMAQEASLAFGEQTRGVVHPENRHGRVDLGDLKVMGVEPGK